ncbi:FliM/FliN family flagellar motor switch protein, partial [bacterium]|nr:FliM/FliN family flagellar motor switch protein [bacterium]
EINLSVKELLELTLQDVIRLNVKPNDELILKVGEHPKFKYRPGTSGKRMAAQVSQVL